VDTATGIEERELGCKDRNLLSGKKKRKICNRIKRWESSVGKKKTRGLGRRR